MKHISLFLIMLFLFPIFETSAQNISFPDDAIERGYFNRPYKRYEAEPEKCQTNGIILEATYDQRELQSEASNQIAVQLVEKEAYIQWTNKEEANGLVIRFSIPDGLDGNGVGVGSKGTLALFIDNEYVQDIVLDSYWAWQYFNGNGSNYPDNTPTDSKFARMRFNEAHLLLDKKIPENSTFKLVKKDDNSAPYTIDFIELENVAAPLSFDDIEVAEGEEKVMYDSKENLVLFLMMNEGKTIFLPPGKHEATEKIILSKANTKVIGAGMWYTEVYFSASSDDLKRFNKRGFECYGSSTTLEGLYINTINNKRYYNNNSSYQVGKGLMGSFGSNSTVKNVWVEHFECGGWITEANQLKIQNCRFRNNYADGINLASASKNSTVEYCSFRNNGDDDMASWTTNNYCMNNTFQYCTAENNWRASSLGFFGGQENKAHHIVIIDPMESGARINCDFDGKGFSSIGYFELHDISIYKGGVASGSKGIGGDLWGNRQAALSVKYSNRYDIQNVKVSNLDIYDSKDDAIEIGGSGSKEIKNLILENIQINGTNRYGIFYNNSKGNGTYCDISYNNIGATSNTTALPSAFDFKDCHVGINTVIGSDIRIISDNNKLILSGLEKNTLISIYDILGRKEYEVYCSSEQIITPNLTSGIHLVKLGNYNTTIKVMIK